MRFALVACLLLASACGARSALSTPPPCETAADCGAETEDVCQDRVDCVAGACVEVAALECDDGNDCTVDTCDLALGGCWSQALDEDEDGFGPLRCGSFDCDDADPRVNPAAAEVCAGGLDEDCDGRTDCSDSDCFGRPGCESCAPEECGNGLDEDCDGVVDCDDSDCLDSPVCCEERERRCDDGLDEDCDGAVDCDDGDCEGAPACCRDREEQCADGLDEDCDGAIDCDDDDCANSPPCCTPTPETCNGEDDDCDGAVDDGLTCFTRDGQPLAAIRSAQCGDVFYAYDNPDTASANPSPDLRRRDQAVIFVHESTSGCGSSVGVIVDVPDSSGGSLTGRYSISPARAANVFVSDEPNECSVDSRGDGACGWRWMPCCTDGVLLGPFTEDFCVTLTLSAPSGVSRAYVLDGTSELAQGFGETTEICGTVTPRR